MSIMILAMWGRREKGRDDRGKGRVGKGMTGAIATEERRGRESKG